MLTSLGSWGECFTTPTKGGGGTIADHGDRYFKPIKINVTEEL